MRGCIEPRLNGDHFKIGLGDPAGRACPTIGHLFPKRTGGYALFGQAIDFVIDKAADHTHPRLIDHGIVHCHLVENFTSLSHRCTGNKMNTTRSWPKRGLYLLTPDEIDTTRLLTRARPLLEAGVALLQYRNKLADAALRHEQAVALLGLCQRYEVPLIINDDWQLAADIGAHGAHLGQQDGALRVARAALGRSMILGASCYNDLTHAECAAATGASYLAFGALYPSQTKPLALRAPLALLQQAARFNLPIVAIGGITPDNAAPIVSAGADLLAVLGAVFDAADPVAVVRAFHSCFQ